MKKKGLRRILGLCLALLAISPTPVFADQQNTIPVTLTVVHSIHSLDVTMPLCMPVSVLNGTVLTANNVQITNNSVYDDVEISSIQINGKTWNIGDYENFPTDEPRLIAMSINGCPTKGSGELGINDTAFPAIGRGKSLPLAYEAKVSDSVDMTGAEVAQVIFTLRAVAPKAQ